MSNFIKTNYGRKVVFEEILSKKLSGSIFKIEAFYESVTHKQIMSIRKSDVNRVHLGINTSFKEEKMFSDCSESMLLSIVYRAYFIVNFIRCLETARETVPTSYFSGLVVLAAAEVLSSADKKRACSPDVFGRNKMLSPIDVHCAIRALTNVMLEYEAYLTEEAKKLCERHIDYLITYTALPEIEYIGSKHPQYTSLNGMKKLNELILMHPEVLGEYSLFSQKKITSFKSLSVDGLLDICDDDEDRFWPGIILRVLALSKDFKKTKLYLNHSSLKSTYLEFCSSGVEYYSNELCTHSLLLKDNLCAIQLITRELDQPMVFNISLESGMMHYIR